MFGRKKKEFLSGSFDYLIVGLGNPGTKYQFTKHNAGFMCLDLFADDHGLKINKLKFKSLLTDCRIGSKRCILLKPQTFMNNSGEAVRDCADFYKIPPERIIVIFDDVSLDLGRIRIRRKGSAGGHNGIKSIIYHLNSDEFQRVKIGVGKKPDEDWDLADWVLKPFTKEELLEMRKTAQDTENIIELMVEDKTEEAMAKYNS
ncbi:MAG: aminoacyl-tRNA hydrolase [Clostridia bacterium]|nr:aminoacyl-tRNA hydrolase [Clostridia bacterium]